MRDDDGNRNKCSSLQHVRPLRQRTSGARPTSLINLTKCAAPCIAIAVPLFAAEREEWQGGERAADISFERMSLDEKEKKYPEKGRGGTGEATRRMVTKRLPEKGSAEKDGSSDERNAY